jgi:hypothetical protein
MRSFVEAEGLTGSGVVGPEPAIFESSLGAGILESDEAQTQVDQFATTFIDPVSNL